MSALPIYRLAKPDIGPAGVIDLADRMFGITDYQLDELEGRLVLRDGRHVVEIDRTSGGIWAADESVLWNPDAKGRIPSEGEARDIAEKHAAELKLLPQLPKRSPFSLTSTSGGTHLALRTGKGKRQDRALDAQVTYAVQVAGPDKRPLPIIGGGAKLKITLGDKGRLIAASTTWREPTGASFEAAQIPEGEVKRKFQSMFDGVELRDTEIVLAYYAAPFGVEQEYLYPVYVLRGSAIIDGTAVPLRQPSLAATEFGPEPPTSEPQKPRTEDKQVVAAGQARGKGKAKTKATTGRQNRSYATPRAPFESGASYIGVSGGLSGSQGNTQGFIDGLAADGWTTNFLWGDGNAWESDWNRNDDAYVDAADFVWYTGHANQDGWVLAAPDDGFLRFSELGGSPATPGDKWGQQDLEWAIIAACGPLQDEILAKGGGNVLSRWDGAFDGLHLLMGYGAVTFDNTLEGGRIITYARQGQTLRSAWFRTAQEIQPATNGVGAPDGPTVWVGTMWAAKSGANPVNDRLWGHGSVSSDPTGPTTLGCMWTTC